MKKQGHSKLMPSELTSTLKHSSDKSFQGTAIIFLYIWENLYIYN